ncbi:MAG TPA: MxaK protein [Caldimonas sp.]
MLVLLVLIVTTAAIDGARTWRQHRWNQVIASGQLPAEGADVPAQVQFAQAYAQAASGAEEAALHRYRNLQDDSPLGQAARYNSANLLIRQAIEIHASSQPGKAIALIELAKEIYRDVLRVDPQHWDARYNLERAQRLLADPDEQEVAPPESKRDAERAATTMRGYSPGLP